MTFNERMFWMLRFLKEQRRSALEEKIRVLQTSRDELQAHSTQQSNLVNELQSRNAQLSIDNESLRRRLADLQQVKASTELNLRRWTASEENYQITSALQLLHW